AADVASFADTLYTDGNSVYYINGKFEAASVVTNVYAPYLAGDGKTLTYMRSDSIYQVDGTNDSAERVELVDGGVFQFVATADGKAVFFVNDDYEVCYQKGRGKPVTVGEDFTANPGVFRLFKGQKLFYVSDDELCSSSGGKGVSVRGIDGDVLSVSGGMYGVTVTTDDGGETLTYYSADGNKFTLSN
ncbi:MAG: hypothetical protein LBU58_07525, partial [Clostridiales bacterium]|nr:hypothetical protein [Clostridiales bacterium]